MKNKLFPILAVPPDLHSSQNFSSWISSAFRERGDTPDEIKMVKDDNLDQILHKMFTILKFI